MDQTIAAVSTPPGLGAVGMVRLSGRDALAVAARVFSPGDPARPLTGLGGYSGVLGRVHTPAGEPVDDVVAFVYRAPKSYTGEDVVELCCHGGEMAVWQVLRLCLDAGAAPAGPGEFTRRAYTNGKLDLSQAEAVMDLISAQGQGAMRAALAARDGALAREINRLSGELLARAAHIAAWSDYPEEDLAPVDREELFAALTETARGMEALLQSYDRGRLLREGAATAIVGKPNVGKSTLMNLLTGQESSIVTELPGTTRDVVRDTVRLGGLVLHLLDTAGIRPTADRVEQMGVDRSLAQLETADLILAVFDRSEALGAEDEALLRLLRGKSCVAVVNKSDLPPQMDPEALRAHIPAVVTISAQTGEGRQELEEAVGRALGMARVDPSAALVANERQRRCLGEALAALGEGRDALAQGMTLDAVGVCIDTALDSLLAVTGQRATDAVVEEVFARFCVGK